MLNQIQLQLATMLGSSKNDLSDHGTRRCLRFMRLERRLMLSGDFGEDFGTDDDDEDEDDHHREVSDFLDNYEIDHDDDDEADEDSNDPPAFSQNDDFSAIGRTVNEISDASLLGDSDQDDRTHSDAQLELDVDLNDSDVENIDNESVLPSNSGANASEAAVDEVLADIGSKAQTVSSEPINDAVPDLMTPQQSALATNESPNLNGAAATEMQTASDSDTNGGTANQTTNRQLQEDTQRRAVVLAHVFSLADNAVASNDLTAPSDSDELNATSIAWLGSFSDDLSAIDEALNALIADTHSVAESSIGNLLQHGPLITTGIVTSGLAAGAIYQRKRIHNSRLEDDHYAVRFDARLYPELFG